MLSLGDFSFSLFGEFILFEEKIGVKHNISKIFLIYLLKNQSIFIY